MGEKEFDRQSVQQWMLDRDLSLDQLEQVAAIAAFVHRDPACAEAIRDYDRLRELLSQQAPPPAAEPSGGWRGFEERMVAVASATGLRERRRAWWWRGGAMGAIAAGVAVVVALWAGGSFDPAMPRPGASAVNDAAASEAYLPEPVLRHVGVFDRLADVYGQRTGWVAFANGQPELGLTEQPVNGSGRLLVLRLTMSRDGHRLSQADLVIVPGQRAELDLPLPGGETLRYQLHAGDTEPVALGVWARLEGRDGGAQTIAALATTLTARADAITPAGRLVTQAGDYELTLGFRKPRRD